MFFKSSVTDLYLFSVVHIQGLHISKIKAKILMIAVEICVTERKLSVNVSLIDSVGTMRYIVSTRSMTMVILFKAECK